MSSQTGQLETKTETGRRNETLLIERFRRGDPRAFEQIVSRHMDDIRRLAARLLGWPADTDDLVQDVFAAAWRHRRRFRADCSLKSWLFTITLNQCRTHRRRRMLWNRFLKKQTQAEAVPAEAPDFGPVRQAVAALPEKYRQVIVLKYLEDLPAKETQNLLNISEAALNTRLTRARQQLQETLKNWTQSI